MAQRSIASPAIEEANPDGVDFVEFAHVLVHRSKSLLLGDGTTVLPQYHFNIDNYSPETCPYCAAGSIAIKAKSPAENWEILQAESAAFIDQCSSAA